MAKSSELSSHEKRAANLQRQKQALISKAEEVAADYLYRQQPFNESNMEEHYHAIDNELSNSFTTFNQYRCARQGFLQAVRTYNKDKHCSLDEPVVPIVAERDRLTISYDWFVQGSKLSETWEGMQLSWQRKLKFSANNYISYFLYSSIMFGGLNDIEVLRALYQWLFSDRKLHLVNLEKQTEHHKKLDANKILLVIPLEIRDDKYGCRVDGNEDALIRYVSYIPDDLSLMFLYALSDTDVNKRKIQQFETIIKGLNNTFELTCRDPKKIHLSHLIKYANFHWRQLPDSYIDGANSLVMQGQLKTTSLPTEQLLSYNQEIIQSTQSTITWQQLFVQNVSRIENPGRNKGYPDFSKNIIQFIQNGLKGTRTSAKDKISDLKNDFPQPNAIRLLGWVLSLLEANQTNLDSVSKYIGCIGREWLMLTMDEDLEEWGTNDYEEIYEQVILSKVKDARKKDILQKDPIDDRDDIELDYDDIKSGKGDDPVPDLTQALDESNESKNEGQQPTSLDELKNTQSYTYGRLRAFHRYQMQYFDAPDVIFAWGENKQVVKASMVSPRVYKAMHKMLLASELNQSHKLLCQTILILAYRTGMRINEIAGIKLKNVKKLSDISVVLTPNPYLRLKSSSAKRRILLAALLKKGELRIVTLFIAQQERMGASYLFSQGASRQPLPTYFFSNLMRILWDGVLGQDKHNYTFHSLRHTAISQLALAINGSALAEVMTDYTIEECQNIADSLAGYHHIQGAWFGLASFVGHLTCDTTFEHYIHTSHLLAGSQLSKAEIAILFTVLQNITGIDYQTVNYHDKTAYNKSNKTVVLKKLRPYFAKKLKAHHNPLFIAPDVSAQLIQQNTEGEGIHRSIFIDTRYDAVISFIREIDKIRPELREKDLENIAIKHGIYLNNAQELYKNAISLNNNDKLITQVKGQTAQAIITTALDKAYNMSVQKPDTLREFVRTYQKKHITSRSYLKFGIKKSQHELLAEFLRIGCEIINPQHWQLTSSSIKEVRDFKKKHKLNSAIKVETNQNCVGFEVRVVRKMKSKYVKQATYESSGVLKFLGEMLVMLLDWSKDDE
ncbi:tyrosine-type recombinase/integrase [Psychrobacter sp. ANT_H56B]|uniref:tyrosine-type recombinase/integrase n=1 Tax=Psychrobacter sp. ANT_H56B TaxID=2597353 RepID=UPI0011F34C4C|nr:tyrosine-type recombinase/integrase [Psychrobacter sp. ANT_H56B]KAA0926911.1 tyrosine-type recombinase/integrase [Psychrobacter sp. ANT_H56B]